MLFIPMKPSEHGAIGNHTDWKIDDRCIASSPKVLIRCTCHDDGHPKQDMRWILKTQIKEK